MKSYTINEISKESSLDNEEIIVTLWDNGYDYINKSSNYIHKSDINDVKKIFNIATKNELTSINYWIEKYNITENEFNEILKKLDIKINKNAKKLPQGSIKKIKKYFNTYNSNPVFIIEKTEYDNDFSSPPLKNIIIGHKKKDISYLTVDEVLFIHYEIFKDYKSQADPIDTHGAINDHIINFALFRPQCRNGSIRKYPTIEMAGAALLHSLIFDHLFHNGNKRTALR